jgi:hypothetical protein
MNLQHLNDLSGLKFMPVKANKMPIVKGWQTFAGEHDLSNCSAVGLVCGKLSGGLEVIDVDTKYDLTGKIFENYKRLVHEIDKSILNKVVVQKTKSGGYHIIYRCSVIAGNQKLANRPTTKDERDFTYTDTYNAEITKSQSDAEAKKIAQKASDNDKVRVLFETRGEGGYIMCFPSQGYELIYGDYYSINEITPEEREVLHGIARQFNEVVEEYIVPIKTKTSIRTKGLSPCDDYNERGDVVGLLQQHGWKIVNTRGTKTHLRRPGQTTAMTSGNFDSSNNWFSVFTTSTEFEPERAYLPYVVFAVLECNKNISEAAKKLYDLGYGDRHDEGQLKKESTRVIQSRIKPDDNDYSFLATPNDYDGYLKQVIDGTLPMGLTTGSPTLDVNYLLKEGDFVMTNGIDNTGKSVWVWWLCLLAAMYHGWKGIIFSSENTIGAFMRKMIQFYWGKPLRGNNAMTQMEYDVAKKFIEAHFKVIKAQEDLFNYKDILNMVKKTNKIFPAKYGMIDPYNSLKIDLSGFSKLNTHEYHYEALSELKAYGQQNNFGWFINHHAVTNAARAKDAERKYPLAPTKADTEGGQKVANKADTFLTIHRITQHPTDWMVTEIHVQKIKDTETGGKPTPKDSPVKFEMYKHGCAFIERVDGFGNAVDPIQKWHQTKNGGTYQPELRVDSSKNNFTWSPLPDDKKDLFDDETPFGK